MVGAVAREGNFLNLLADTNSVYQLSMDAIRSNVDLETFAAQRLSKDEVDYNQLESENRLSFLR